MPSSITSFDYSEANILGWLAAEEQSLPTYAQLLQVANYDSVDVRKQALQRWGLFKDVQDWSAGWANKLLDEQLSTLQISLPTRYGIDDHSYITDYVWLQRWMTRIRHMARKSFLEKEGQSDHEYLVHFFERVFAEVDIPEDMQSIFFVVFDDALQSALSLQNLESNLDRVNLLLQIQHLSKTSSQGIKQWIMLQALITWIQQYTRAVSLSLSEPIWESWFPPEIVPIEFESFESLQDALWRSLTGGSEWLIAQTLEMLEPSKSLTTDSVELEQRMQLVLSQFLNESLYTQDMYMQIMRYVFQIKLVVDTAAVVTLPSLPDQKAVSRATCNFDL